MNSLVCCEIGLFVRVCQLSQPVVALAPAQVASAEACIALHNSLKWKSFAWQCEAKTTAEVPAPHSDHDTEASV